MSDEPHSARSAARIVVVDDDPIMREVASTRLAAAGYHVSAYFDGAAALAHLRNQGADLVISDIEMPAMNGLDLTRAVRSNPSIADTPVIVITGSEQPETVEEAFGAGATSFLSKPMNWTLFIHSVRFVLKASQDRQELKGARDLAEAGARFKDSLMSVMSHELRTPLNAIIGFRQILGEHFSADRDFLRREYADYIVDGGKRLLNSVSDMLLASDARSGPIAINEIDCTVGEVVEFAVSATEKAAQVNDVSVRVALDDPETEICCDRNLLTRALMKIIDNAIKFSPRAEKIIVAAAPTANGGLAFAVTDKGPGIAPERIVALAQPFAQGDMSLRRSKEGLGLGLPLAQAIVEAHGGALKIAPTETGACVVITIPARRVITRARANHARAVA